MDEADLKVLAAVKAVKAVIAVADSNFPGRCDLRIDAVGSNTASIIIPAFRLTAILKSK